jgi:hypothetical protein
MPVRDHGEAIEQEEQEGKADGDNGAGEECIKWEIDGKRRQRGTRQSVCVCPLFLKKINNC